MDGGSAVVLSSPLSRAMDTAEPIARSLGVRLRVDPDLAEIDFGALDGLTWEEIARVHPVVAGRILDRETPDWPGGETAIAVARRAANAAARILEISATASVVVVSHGGMLGAIAPLLGFVSIAEPFDPATARRLDPIELATR
jgi:broad specificity phosphatase PhoE